LVDTRRTGESHRSDDAAGTRHARQAPKTVFSLSDDETFELGRTVARGLRGGDLILLEGDLGLGKTVFAKGIAAGLGIAPEDVTSPSFTLVQEYAGGRLPMFHVDLYRLEDPEDLATIGIEEVLSGGGVVVVEWGERLPPYLRRGAIRVSFHDIGEGSRRIEVLPREPGRTPEVGGA
jgi:tRNA threonylcarbamoyladenosine biosynthesis protein TsaE